MFRSFTLPKGISYEPRTVKVPKSNFVFSYFYGILPFAVFSLFRPFFSSLLRGAHFSKWNLIAQQNKENKIKWWNKEWKIIKRNRIFGFACICIICLRDVFCNDKNLPFFSYNIYYYVDNIHWICIRYVCGPMNHSALWFIHKNKIK